MFYKDYGFTWQCPHYNYVFSNPWNFKIAVLLLDWWCTNYRTNSSTGKIMCILLSWRNFVTFSWLLFPRINLSTWNISCPHPCKKVHPHLSHMEHLLCSLVRDNTVFKMSTPLPWWFFLVMPPPPRPNHPKHCLETSPFPLEFLIIHLGMWRIFSRGARCIQCWLYPYKVLLIARVLVLLF